MCRWTRGRTGIVTLRPHVRPNGRACIGRAGLPARVYGGLHPDHIGRLERGTWTGGTRIDNIRKLAEALGVQPPEILADED